ncbi:MAG: hypothetical protein KDK39_15715 [Leptospiraceae bacterium]|nr:hypothetical protein [Leptospiraceae bacterium]
MSKFLFLDDIRVPDFIYSPGIAEKFSIVRSYQEFVEFIQGNGLPDFISFDNDLGEDENGVIP